MGTENDDIAANVCNDKPTQSTIDAIKQKSGRYQDTPHAIGDTKSPPPSTVNPFGSLK